VKPLIVSMPALRELFLEQDLRVLRIRTAYTHDDCTEYRIWIAWHRFYDMPKLCEIVSIAAASEWNAVIHMEYFDGRTTLKEKNCCFRFCVGQNEPQPQNDGENWLVDGSIELGRSENARN